MTAPDDPTSERESHLRHQEATGDDSNDHAERDDTAFQSGADERPDADGAPTPTRRRLLQAGVGAGTALSSLGGLGSSTMAATETTIADEEQEEDAELAPPTHLREEWAFGGGVGIAWDWQGERCGNDLSHFEVEVQHGDGEVERHVVAPTRYAFQTTVQGTETTFLVRAVDAAETVSEPARLVLRLDVVDQNYQLEPAASPAVQPGETAVVPIDLTRVVGPSDRLARYELGVSVRAPCVARIVDVSVPEGQAVELTDVLWAEDDATVRVSAEGLVTSLDQEPLLHVEVAGVGNGETILDVTDRELVVLDEDWTYEEFRYYVEDPEELPEDVDLDDLATDHDALTRWTTVDVGADGTAPAPPENLRSDWHVSSTVGLRWDWPGDPCGDDLSHFLVRTYAQRPDEPNELLERQVVPPGAAVETVDVDRPTEELVLVTVQAVDQDGNRSTPAEETFWPVIADPGHILSPRSPDSAAVEETVDVPIELSAILDDRTGLVRYEFEASVSANCVATIEDARLPDRYEDRDGERSFGEATVEVADDGSTVRFVAEGPPERDVRRPDVATLELSAHEIDAISVHVDPEEFYVLDRDYDYEEYEYARYLAETEDDPELLAEIREDLSAIASIGQRIYVGPPSVDVDALPRDLNGDGLYRDLTASGDVTTQDLQLFFQHQHRNVVDQYPEAYDFTGDGNVGQPDVVDLFHEL